MINDIATIKQIRLDRQTRQVRAIETELHTIREQVHELSNALDTFRQWQQDETKRLFEELKKKAVHLNEMDMFNQTVAGFKTQENDKVLQIKQAQEKVKATEERLETQRKTLYAAQQAKEKFQSLATDFQAAETLKRTLNEEDTNEEIAADSYGSRQNHTSTTNLFAGA